MAGKKDKYLSVVIGNLTDAQAANIQSDIIKSKNKHAPKARAIGDITNKEGVGKILQNAWNNLIEKKD